MTPKTVEEAAEIIASKLENIPGYGKEDIIQAYKSIDRDLMKRVINILGSANKDSLVKCLAGMLLQHSKSETECLKVSYLIANMD